MATDRIRFDDYGFVTFLTMKGYTPSVVHNQSETYFTVLITMRETEKELEEYQNSEFKKFDTASKKIKKMRNIAIHGKR